MPPWEGNVVDVNSSFHEQKSLKHFKTGKLKTLSENTSNWY